MQLMQESDQVFLHQVEVVSATYGQPFVIRTGQDSLVISLDDDHRSTTQSHKWILEQYCGGYGGWNMAIHFLKKLGIHSRCTLAVDHALQSVIQYGLTHRTQIVGCTENMPDDFLHTHPTDTVICADITQSKWMRLLLNLDLDAWCMSAPCPSWSGSGSGKGFFVPDGMCIAHSFIQIRTFKPKAVLFEQVSGFPRHDHFEIFLKLVKWSGYQIAFADNFEQSALTPTRRCRWLALLLPSDRALPEAFSPAWPLGKPSPLDFDALQQIPKQNMHHFQPTKVEAAMYFNQEYMPGNTKNFSQREIINYRLPSLQQPLPTFMAAYGEQHQINEAHLKKRGLYGHFVKQHGSFRFFTPVEVSLLHGTNQPHILLKPKQLAYRSLGNCITPVHSLVLLIPALQYLGDLDEQTICSAELHHLVGTRLRASSCDFREDECAWYVGTFDQTQQLQQQLQHFMHSLQWSPNMNNQWPADSWYSPEMGLVPFDLPVEHETENTCTTQPFDVMIQILPMLKPCQYGTINVEGQMLWATVVHLWDCTILPEHVKDHLPALLQPIQDADVPSPIALMPIDDAMRQQVIEQIGIHDPPQPLVIRHDEALHLYEIFAGSHWSDVCNRMLGPDVPCYDALGLLHTDHNRIFGEVHTHDTPCIRDPDFLEHLMAVIGVQIQLHVPPETDILILQCSGTFESRSSFLHLWNSPQMKDWMTQHGRQICYEDLGSNHWQLIYRPNSLVVTTPVQLLKEQIFFRLLRIALLSLSTPPEMDRTVPCQFHFQDRIIGPFDFPKIMQIQLVIAILQHFGKILAPSQQMQILLPPETYNTTTMGQFPLDQAQLHFPIAAGQQSKVEPEETNDFDVTFNQTNIVVYKLPPARGLYLQYQGTKNQLCTIQRIWSEPAILDWLKEQESFIDLETTSTTLSIQVHTPKMLPIDVDDFLAGLCTRLLFQACKVTQALSGYVANVWFRNQHLQTHCFDCAATLAEFIHHVNWSFRPLHQQADLRVFHDGVRCHSGTTIQELAQFCPFSERITLTLEEPMEGGSPTKPPTSKQDFHKQVESQIATMLLARNVQLPQVPQIVGKLMNQDAPAKLHQLLNNLSNDAYHPDFEQLCIRASVVLLSQPASSKHKAAKQQRQKQHEQHKANLHANANLFTLKSDFFLNEDKTSANLLQTFTPSASGVLLANRALAEQWMQVMKNPVPDELAIYVLGPLDIPDNFPAKVVSAPAFDNHQREVILQGTLIQFGTRHITTSVAKQPQVETNETIVVAVTVWQADFDSQTWNQFLEAPVRTVQQKLAIEGFQGLMLKPWGRNYQQNGKQCEPKKATSLQFHAEFLLNSKFHALLRRSGFSKIYLQPKTESGQPDPRWKIAWLGKNPNLAEVESQLATLSGVAGLVASKRGVGVRVECAHFSHVWQVLFPNQPVPDLESLKHVFKLQPLPLGVDATVLQTWAEQQHDWKIRPLRAVGAKAWIVASNQIPTGILSFNNMPLLLQQLPQKGYKPQNTIAAGPRPKPSDVKVDTVEVPNPKRPTELLGDPWAKYTPTQGTMDAVSIGAASSEQRSIPGPISTRLQQQDSKLLAIEEAVNQLKTDQNTQITAIQQHQTIIEDQLQKQAHHNKQQFDWLAHEHHTLQQSVQASMHKQETKLTQTFEDIKALIQSNRGTKRGPGKQPEKEPHEETEEVDGML
eukprot:Skav202098  [mRNA]  locus=scaffold513:323545:328569:- [translate_table: standard]